MRAAAIPILLALILLGVPLVPALVQAWPRGAALPEPEVWALPDVVARSGHYRAVTFDGHVHTRYSHDARHPTSDVLELCERADLDAVVITDHGSASAFDDFARYTGPVSPLIGEEVGGAFGHAVIWNVRARHGVHEAAISSLSQLGALVHDRGGVLVLAHPGWWIAGNRFDPLRWIQYDALRRGGIADDVDALELWNQQYFRPTRELLDHWDALLSQALYVPIVGNSDFHVLGVDRVGEPRNALLCPTIHGPTTGGTLAQPIETCLVEAVRSGRLYVTDGPSLVFTVAGRTLGEIVPVFAHTYLAVEVEVLAPDGGTLVVRLGPDAVERIPLAPGEALTRSLAVRVPESDSYLRVEVERAEADPRRAPVSLVSNPVRIDVLPLRTDGWRGPDEGRVPAPYGWGRDHAATRRRGRRPRAEEH